MPQQIGYLDVVIPPDFISEDTSSDVIVPEGSSVKLTCRWVKLHMPTMDEFSFIKFAASSKMIIKLASFRARNARYDAYSVSLANSTL